MRKYQLQQFADRTRLKIFVSHFLPGTSKWNKVERRLFCYITKTWQGQPLIDVQTAIDLIGATRTATGLTVICVRDDTEYGLAKSGRVEPGGYPPGTPIDPDVPYFTALTKHPHH
jgi:hypothetical protein